MLQVGAGTGLLYLLRWFWWRITAWCEIVAMISSFAISILFLVFRRSGIELGTHRELLLTIIVTTICWIITAYVGPKTDERTLIDFYHKVHPFGPGWRRVRLLAGVSAEEAAGWAQNREHPPVAARLAHRLRHDLVVALLRREPTLWPDGIDVRLAGGLRGERGRPHPRGQPAVAMTGVVEAPGRVNLIGEHIDYHDLAVLPMALRRRVRVAFEARSDNRVRAASIFGTREFAWTAQLEPVAAGDWENYVRAAAQAVGRKWGTGRGIDAEVTADLPPAAGLSSSSALIVAFTLALLRANEREASFEELMEVLPEGEHFVGTRGGGMDHAASLASREGCASLIGFAPVTVRTVPLPRDWSFLVAHSLKSAEKSGAVREEYNARRSAGSAAPGRLGFTGYRDLLTGRDAGDVEALAQRLQPGRERDAFLHVTTEALRVHEAVAAMQAGDKMRFASLLLDSHASLRDRLRVSCPELDRLVDRAMAAGALGARLTGAGFGGCAVIFCQHSDRGRVREGLKRSFYHGHAEFRESEHLIDADPGDGALHLGR